jgi:hypothetical protein
MTTQVRCKGCEKVKDRFNIAQLWPHKSLDDNPIYLCAECFDKAISPYLDEDLGDVKWTKRDGKWTLS